MKATSETQALARSGAGSLEKALLAHVEVLHQDLSRNRFAEEREWYEEALFFQRRQWLSWDNSSKRWAVIKQDPKKPRPMPVTNHYARTVNALANQLAGGKVRAVVVANDDSDKNRRAAQYAERAIDALDKESGMELQLATLGKHVALWGIGVAKDIYDYSKSTGVLKVPSIEVAEVQKLGCNDCGAVEDVAEQGTGTQTGCPYCGSPNTMNWTAREPRAGSVQQFVEGKITTEVRSIFEFFLPRDCVNPNLAKKVQHRYRKPLSEAKRMWGDAAEDIEVDQRQDTSIIYLEALRSLVNYNYMQEQSGESVSITETWEDWDQLPEELQEQIEEAVASGESDDGNPVLAPDPDLDPVEQLQQWGIFIVSGGGKLLDWGINNLEGEKPYTFFCWDADPANVYPKGAGCDLIPLQKRLNRLDSLIELAYMSNAAGKWLWPSTQTTGKPSGSPADVIEFDPIGDGKMAPQFVLPTPIHQSAYALRAAIKQDFVEIGMTQGVNQGQNPQGVNSFRGLAYLGAKASEQISTQRQLWETAHALRHKKCLILARRYWSQPRKVKVAGFNGRWGMKQVLSQDLLGDYTNGIVENSSRPKTPDDKAARFAALLQGGLIDPTDPATREYVLDESNLDRLNLVDHLQYEKAERDLDMVVSGQMPQLNPYIRVPIFLTVFSNFTLTEEFDELPPDAQQRVLMATQLLSQQVQAAGAAAQQSETQQAMSQKLGEALAKNAAKQQNSALSGVPGETIAPEAAAAAAESEGAGVAAQLP